MPRTMKALVTARAAPRSLELRDVPVPQPGPGDVLVRVQVASICGTDVHIYNWDAWAQKRVRVPLIQGHEWAGSVAALGPGVDGVAPGDYVSGEGHIACWACATCRAGNPHVCPRVEILGIDRPGSFAQFLVCPAVNIVKNDASLPLEHATLQDPLGNAVQTAWSAQPAGKSVAVFGLGPIGLMAITVCQAMGAARVFAIGHRNEARLSLARKLGAARVLRSSDDVEGALREETGGEGVDEVLEMSGSPAAVEQGLRVLRPAGGIHLLGVYPEPVTLDLTRHVVTRGVRVVGIHGRRMFQDWQLMQGLLRSRRLNLDPIITHKLRLGEFEKGFEAMASGNSGKVVMYVDEA